MSLISRIYAFGDSYADSGALLRLIQGTYLSQGHRGVPLAEVDSPHYWEGRWSNGETAIEWLANRLRAELTNYAMGGALTGLTNYSTWLDHHAQTGLLAQIGQFVAGSARSSPGYSDALFFVAAGANDFLLWDEQRSSRSSHDVALEAAANTAAAVSILISAGATTVMVSKCFALSSMPWVRHDARRTEEANAFEEHYNAGVKRAVDSLLSDPGARILWFDWASATRYIEGNSGTYGFADVSEGFLSIGTEDADPDRFLWWDDYHPSRRCHALIGDAMLTVLQDAGARAALRII